MLLRLTKDSHMTSKVTFLLWHVGRATEAETDCNCNALRALIALSELRFTLDARDFDINIDR